MLVMFFFFLFFISPRVLRGPSADRPETRPHGRKLSDFYNPSPKIRGALPPKKSVGQKHAKFRSVLYNLSSIPSSHTTETLLRAISLGRAPRIFGLGL